MTNQQELNEFFATMRGAPQVLLDDRLETLKQRAPLAGHALELTIKLMGKDRLVAAPRADQVAKQWLQILELRETLHPKDLAQSLLNQLLTAKPVSTTTARVIEGGSLVELIGHYVKLERRGGGYVGQCPFHPPEGFAPDLHVNTSRDFFYCFGCQAGGSRDRFLTMVHEADLKPLAIAV